MSARNSALKYDKDTFIHVAHKKIAPVTQHKNTIGHSKIRVDKWLWAARFYKTRSLASEAIKGGKISLNDHRAKASRDINIGDVVVLRQGYDEKTVDVLALSDKRGPASIAQQLYQEHPESISKREKEKELRKLSAQHSPQGEGRPTKRSRRQIHRFTQSGS
jgi:ribosome-associated heat shock protein Hsp15